MKMPINWHREMLRRRCDSLARKEDELKRQQQEVEKTIEDISIYRAQIERAEFLRKDGFDEDKFMRKKK